MSITTQSWKSRSQAVIAAFFVLSLPASSQERAVVEPKSLPAPDQKIEPVQPIIEKLDDSRLKVGDVILDRKSREIRFPASVNMDEGLLEYLIVHENGKVHEALLVTKTSPTHVNLAFTLLRYPPSRELYALPNETGGQSDKYPEVPDDVKAAARIAIDVEWIDGGKTRRMSINEWVQHAVKTTAMPAGPWVYGGSEFFDGKYSPEMSGDIVAIFLTGSAIVNYPGEDNRDDTVWISYPKRVPAVGTPVTVIFRPYSKVTEKPSTKTPGTRKP